MNFTGTSVQVDHVLRHTFRANQPFHELLEDRIEPGSDRPRFSYHIRSLATLALDAVDVSNYKYSNQIAEVRHSLEKNETIFPIAPMMAIKKLSDRALIAYFAVENSEALRKLIFASQKTLMSARFGSDEAPQGYNLAVRLFDKAPDAGDVRIAERFKELYFTKSGQHLFEVYPESLAGINEETQVYF